MINYTNTELLAELKRRRFLVGSPFTSMDVEEHAVYLGYNPTHEDVERIIDNVDRLYDPEIGLNWDVLKIRIEQYYGKV